jgi:hypothetical protein
MAGFLAFIGVSTNQREQVEDSLGRAENEAFGMDKPNRHRAARFEALGVMVGDYSLRLYNHLRGLTMKTDAINVTLPNGIELVMFRKVKGLMAKGQEESVEELWARFARALKQTDWSSVIKIYGDEQAHSPAALVSAGD